MIDFKKLADEPKKDIIDPSIIFASLPNKAKKIWIFKTSTR